MSKKHKMACFFPWALTLMLFAACATIQPDPPQVSLKSLEVVELNLSHALIQAELDLINPNNFDLSIASADYKLSLNGVKISSGKSANSVKVPANGRGVLNLDLSSSYVALFSFLQKIEPGESLDYELSGTIELGGSGLMHFPYPIHKTGTINLDGLPR